MKEVQKSKKNQKDDPDRHQFSSIKTDTLIVFLINLFSCPNEHF